MAEAQLQQFLEKVAQLNAFVALSEAHPELRAALSDCNHHHEVVALARAWGFEIGRRWGDPGPGTISAATVASSPPAGDGNLLAGAPPSTGHEQVQVLLQAPGMRLERIHSCLAATPANGWYEQEEHEWVLLLSGSARLQFADEPVVRDLAVGDSLLITPGRRHRVVATDPAPGTVWLALFWGPGADRGPAAPANTLQPGQPPPPPDLPGPPDRYRSPAATQSPSGPAQSNR